MMTAEQLKGSILQLAMQGKLVEQRTSERIAVFKKGKDKETEELDFEIPMTWIIAHLETVVDSVASKQYQIKESEVKPEGKYRVISQSKEYSIGYCSDNSKLYHHTQPVIVFGDHTTEVKFIDFDFVVGADGIKIFNPNTDIIEPRFLFYQLQFYTRGLNKVGGYSRHYKFIKNKPIVIPPFEEQKRIVAKIEELMPFVEQYASVSTKLNMLNTTFPEMMKKSILQEAVQGKLVPQDPNDEPASLLLKKIAEEKKRLIKEGKIKKQKPLPEITEDEVPFDIPESWEWVRVGSYFNTSSGTTPSKSNNEYYDQKDINWVRTTDLNNGVLDKCEIQVSQKAYEECRLEIIPQDSVCIAMYGGGGTIGKNALIKFDTTINQSVCAIHPNGCNMKYIQLYMQHIRPRWMDFASGSRKDPNINQIIIKNCLIPIPPLKEQKRIVEIVTKLMDRIGQL